MEEKFGFQWQKQASIKASQHTLTKLRNCGHCRIIVPTVKFHHMI